MSHFVQVCSKVLPTAIGGGILGVSIVGLGAAIVGATIPVAIEAISALVGAVLIGFAS